MEFAEKLPALVRTKSTFYVNRESASAYRSFSNALPSNVTVDHILGNNLSEHNQQHVQRCRLLACTTQAITDELIQDSLGITSSGFLQIIDDASYLEALQTLAMVPSVNRKNFRGLIIAGDLKQDTPATLTTMLSEQINQPTSNVSDSLLARRSYVPINKLTKNCRMVPTYQKFSSMHTYNRELTTFP